MCIHVWMCIYAHISTVCMQTHSTCMHVCVCYICLCICVMYYVCVCIYVMCGLCIHMYACMYIDMCFIHTHLRSYTTIKQKLSHEQLHKKCFLTGGVVLLIMCKPFMFIATSTDRSAVPKNLETKELLLSICPLNKTDLEITSEISAHIHSYIRYIVSHAKHWHK